MKTRSRIELIAKNYNVKLDENTIVDTLPMQFKFDIIQDMLEHVNETGVEYPTYGNINFKSSILMLIAMYDKIQSDDNETYLNLIKFSLKTADRMLKAYIKGISKVGG